MFNDPLPFRHQLASSTANFAPVGGLAATVDGAAHAFTDLAGLELSDLSERVSFLSTEGEIVEPSNYEPAESDELTPLLALMAPIVDTPQAQSALANASGETAARTAAPVPTMPATPAGDRTGDGDLAAQAPQTVGADEQVLADPDGDVAAMLRRVRAAPTASASVTATALGTDRAAAQPAADPDIEHVPAARSAETASADAAPRVDHVQQFAAQTRPTAPAQARLRPDAETAAIRATQLKASSGDQLSVPPTDSAERLHEPREIAAPISDLRVGGTMRQALNGTTSRIRGTDAADRSMARGETVEADYEIDLSTAEAPITEDLPLPRQMAAPAAEMRAGQPAPFAVNLAAASSAGQPDIETGARTDPAQTLPLDQRFGERLGAMVGAAMGNATLKDGMLRLQVTPEHLGPIEIEMDTSGTSERLQITVENEAVRQAVAQANARIEQELRQAGAKLAGIDVALRDTGADAQGNAHTNAQTDTAGRRPGSAATPDTGPTGADGSDSIEDRPAPRPGQPGNILYA